MTTIDKANPLPYYEQLAELLRREITDRQASGETYQLSSENELAEQHGLSRATVRHTLSELSTPAGTIGRKGSVPLRRPAASSKT